MQKRIFTSESVTEGHPDKVCDQISDGVLDAILAQDKNARVACESIATTGMVLVMGEISTDCYVDIPSVVRETLCKIGYDSPLSGFNGKTCAVLTAIDEQSGDIAMGVNNSYDDADTLGAGDQGMMFGYACDETEELMPAPISFAHKLTKKLAAERKNGNLPWLRPDGKSQVSVQYAPDGSVERIDNVVISTQHSDEIDIRELREEIVKKIIRPTLPENLLDAETKFYVNPTGRFVIGGPVGDSGLTGRKIIVDTYGGFCRHGGGALSGKDPSKVDRSGLYMARYICKNLVAAGVAKRVELQVAYAIGMSHPVAVYVDTFGTGVIPDDKIVEIVNEVFDLRPLAIIRQLKLDRPIYRMTSNYGHLGREIFTWEQTDKVDEIISALNARRF